MDQPVSSISLQQTLREQIQAVLDTEYPEFQDRTIHLATIGYPADTIYNFHFQESFENATSAVVSQLVDEFVSTKKQRIITHIKPSVDHPIPIVNHLVWERDTRIYFRITISFRILA